MSLKVEIIVLKHQLCWKTWSLIIIIYSEDGRKAEITGR